MAAQDRRKVNQKRVIIADSSQNLLEGIRGLLETVFDLVVMVANFESLIDTAEKLQVDMVVVDLSLTAKRCKEAIRIIKKRFPDIKVLVMSIHDENSALQEAISAGADGFVLKSSAAKDLIPAVNTILSGGTFFSIIKKS